MFLDSFLHREPKRKPEDVVTEFLQNAPDWIEENHRKTTDEKGCILCGIPCKKIAELYEAIRKLHPELDIEPEVIR